MKVLRFIDSLIGRIAGWTLIAVLTAMIILSFGQVVLRNFWGSAVEWGDTLLRHFVLWLGFLGATLAAGENRHIRVDFLSRFVTGKKKKILAIFTSLFSASVCIFLLKASVVFMEVGLDPESILLLNIPTSFFVAIIPAGYGMMTYRFLFLTLEWVIEIVHGDWSMKGAHH